MDDLRVEYISIDDVKPYENNSKKHPKEQIEQIKQSIIDYGFNDPIAIRGDTIVEGHGRYMALKELGWAYIPVIRLDHMDEEQMKAYVLVHNQITMNSGLDLKKAKEELQNIRKYDMKKY